MKSRLVLLAAALLWLPSVLSAQRRGVVDFSVNYMRAEPDYTSGLENQNLMGTVVEILDQDGYWLKIKSPEPYIGWVNELGVIPMEEEELAAYLRAPKYICTADLTYIYRRPDAAAGRMGDLVAGDLLRISFRPDGKKPVCRNGFAEVILPSGKTGYVRKSKVAEFRHWTETRRFTAENLIRTARRLLGVPYFWGGASTKGVDCSGLVRTACFLNGVLLPRNASDQVHTGLKVDIGEPGHRTTEALQPGDLLFFGNLETGRVTHVAIYIGGDRFIHSSQVVRINHLHPTGTDRYNGIARLLYARRILGQENRGTGIITIRQSPDYFAE